MEPQRLGEGSPWDRQRDPKTGDLEPAKDFERFDLYFLPQGPERSLLGAYKLWREARGRGGRIKSNPPTWDSACAKWRWWERAEAYDAEQRRLRLVADQQARQEMIQEHAAHGRDLRRAGRIVLRRFLRRLANDPDAIPISADEARRMIESGIRIERQALGMPEWLLAYAEMTDEQLLAEWEQLIRGTPGSRQDDGIEK